MGLKHGQRQHGGQFSSCKAAHLMFIAKSCAGAQRVRLQRCKSLNTSGRLGHGRCGVLESADIPRPGEDRAGAQNGMWSCADVVYSTIM